jgi:hypothetical protein
MALKEDGYVDYGLPYILVTPRNDDQTEALPGNIIGGAGPFDFTGAATIAAVPLIAKIDNAAIETVLVDLSGAAVVDDTAVTVAELVTAIGLAPLTGIVASSEAVTGRLKFVAASGTRVQVYGELAEIARIGQGLGVKIVTSNTGKSFSTTPIVKDEETFTNTTAAGVDIEIITDGYRKGVSGSFIDTVNDFFLRRMFEGGSINATSGQYDVPTSLSTKIYFKIEIFYPQYLVTTQKEAEITRYMLETIYSAKGAYADMTHERGIAEANYTYTATAPVLAGVVTKDSSFLPLTVEDFVALDIENISA